METSTVKDLLKLYLGQHAGEAVARGEIKRGESLKIVAAILVCDIRGSTEMVRTLGMDRYIAGLNSLFDDIAPAVRRRNGEVLQFTGDGLLAVFQETPEARAQGIVCPIAVKAAFDAAQEADQTLRSRDETFRVGFGLSYGTVAYGNVGAADRLTFTVISEEVSRADRLQRLCPLSGSHIVLSDEFAAHLPPGTTQACGCHSLKGFDAETLVHIPASGEPI